MRGCPFRCRCHDLSGLQAGCGLGLRAHSGVEVRSPDGDAQLFAAVVRS